MAKGAGRAAPCRAPGTPAQGECWCPRWQLGAERRFAERCGDVWSSSPPGPATTGSLRVSWSSVSRWRPLEWPGLKDLPQVLRASCRCRSGEPPRAGWKGVPSGRQAGCTAPCGCSWRHRWQEKVLFCITPILLGAALLQDPPPPAAWPGACPVSQSLCPEVKPPRDPGDCCQRPRHWQRSFVPWGAAGAVPCSGGPSPWGAASHSLGLCPEPEAPPAGRRGGQ